MDISRGIGEPLDLAGKIQQILSGFSFLPRISFTNILEIIIIAFLVYEILLWIKNTRAWTLLKGILVILAFTFIAWILNLYTI